MALGYSFTYFGGPGRIPGACYVGCVTGTHREGSFTGDIGIDADAEVDVDRNRHFGCFKGLEVSSGPQFWY